MDMLKMEFKKHDDLSGATDNLKDSSIGKQMNLYFAICLQLCKRFTNDELLAIIDEQTKMINERN